MFKRYFSCFGRIFYVGLCVYKHLQTIGLQRRQAYSILPLTHLTLKTSQCHQFNMGAFRAFLLLNIVRHTAFTMLRFEPEVR